MKRFWFEHPDIKKRWIHKMSEWRNKNPDAHNGKNHNWYGKKHSAITKKKMAIARKKWHENHPYFLKGENHPNYGNHFFAGENNPMYNKHHTEQTKIKISSALKGKYCGINSFNYGKHRSEEFKKKLSESKKKLYENNPELIRRGEKHPFYGKRGEKSLSWGRHHTDEIRKKLSKMKIEYFRKHPPTYPKPFFVPELGHFVRSSWEKEVGMILRNAGISYGYETTRFDLGDCSYTPDFELSPETFIEIKGFLSDKGREKLLKFKKICPNINLIGIGNGDNKIYNTHLKWDERERVVDIIRGGVSI